MKSIRFIVLLAALFGLVATRGALAKPQIVADYAKQPLSFEINRGQFNKRAQFVARAPGFNLFLAPREAVFDLHRAAPRTSGAGADCCTSSPDSQPPRRAVLRLKMLGARRDARLSGVGQLAAVANYFIGEDRRAWRTKVPRFAKVRAQNIYRGIDAIFYGNDQRLEYDFVVAPHADARAIRLGLTGAKSIALNARGDLIMRTAAGDVVQHAPLIYQEINGAKQRVAGRYKLFSQRKIGFEIGAYDSSRSLIIDPILTYSTYLGGSGDDQSKGITTDAAGNVYVTGSTKSPNFPISGAFQPSLAGEGDAFVSKFDANGALLYSTYLGGGDTGNGSLAATDTGNAIAVDSAGNAYMAGQFGFAGYGDAWVLKLNPSGGLVYSGIFPGGEADSANAIAVDGAGQAYITGITESSNFLVTPGAFQTQKTRAAAAFVAKINAAGDNVIYSTYITAGDLSIIKNEGHGIAIDGAGNAYIAGETDSTAFPTTAGAVQTTAPNRNNGFVSKLSADGAALLYSTFLGTNFIDAAYAIAIDGGDNVYVTGITYGPGFPTTSGAFQSQWNIGTCTINPQPPANSQSCPDAFVAKLNTGSGLIYSTYLGGEYSDQGNAITVDGAGQVVVTGRTLSSDFPLQQALQSTTGGVDDAFLTKLNASGSGLIYSTYLGGGFDDSGLDVALDGAGSVYVTGSTYSKNFPTSNPRQPVSGGDRDGFIVKIGEITPTLTLTIAPPIFAENAGPNAALGTVTRNTPTTEPLTVSLSSSEPAVVAVPLNVTIPAGSASATFAISAIDNALAVGTATVAINAVAPGFLMVSQLVSVTEDETPQLTLSVAPTTFAENGGANAATGTVSRNTPVDVALVVTLSSSASNVSSVPANVTIPAGSASVTFAIGAIDDLVAVGTQTSTITASANGFGPSSATVSVTDNETPQLSLVIVPAIISERGGKATGTLTRNTPPTAALAVNLSSSDRSEANVPLSVTIPVGATTTTFAITAADDLFADGSKRVTITAGAVGFVNRPAAFVTVSDNELATLSVSIAPARIAENGVATLVVRRNSEITRDTLPLGVLLGALPAGQVVVPAAVVIPRGAAFVNVRVAGVDDRLADGPRVITVFARSIGFVSASASLVVQDNEAASNGIIGGRITTARTAGNLPVGGVTLLLKMGATIFDSTVSAVNGSYIFRGLPRGVYQIVPTKTGVAFTPTARIANLSTALLSGIDFIATLRPQISGSVLRRNVDGTFSGVPTVTVTARSGRLVFNSRTDRNGNFLFDRLPLGVFEVAPVLRGVIFTPRVRVVKLDATNSIISGLIFGAPPIVPRPGITSPVDDDSQPPVFAAPRSSLSLSSAEAKADLDTISLRFSGPLDTASASDATHFTVSINDQVQEIEVASCNGNTVTLSLLPGTLKRGQSVRVGWNDVLDTQGRTLTGETTISAQ